MGNIGICCCYPEGVDRLVIREERAQLCGGFRQKPDGVGRNCPACIHFQKQKRR